MKIRLVLFAILITLVQCAKQTSPTGGPKDTTPPTLVETDPKHEQTNFKEHEIHLTLDEFVQLKNPREEIIITPSIGKKFEATAKKNKVTLKLNADLKDSTTYSINFRESIEDITERNPARVKIAFSTGTYIDSLMISGAVKEILTDNPVSNYTISLVHASDTFNIFKHPGTWLTLTDKKGEFTLENLKPGRYFLYAFHDKNKNLIVDTKSEPYGFKTEIINLTKSVETINLPVQKLDASKIKLISSRPIFAYYTIRASKSIVDYTITSSDSTRTIESKLEPDLSTIKIYNTINDLDSLQIRFQATDSMEYKIDTLIYMKFNKSSSTKDDMKAEIKDIHLFENNSTLSATILFSKPITQLTVDSIYIQIDSATRTNFSPADITWDKNKVNLQLHKKLTLPNETKQEHRLKTNASAKTESVKEKYQLYLKKGAAISIEADTVEGLTAQPTIAKITDLSIVTIATKSSEDLIVQLLDNNFKVIDESLNRVKFKFENIVPGTYMIRVLVDLNKNGKWDAGNYYTKTSPEPIFFYSNPKGGRQFVLKANWIVGELLISY
jgi:uncharacterized protein (DUF2141 family)